MATKRIRIDFDDIKLAIFGIIKKIPIKLLDLIKRERRERDREAVSEQGRDIRLVSCTRTQYE